MFFFQSMYATALVKGNFLLPTKEQMLEEWQKRADAIRSKGRPISDIHFLGQNEVRVYLTNLKRNFVPVPTFNATAIVIYSVKARDIVFIYISTYVLTVINNLCF